MHEATARLYAATDTNGRHETPETPEPVVAGATTGYGRTALDAEAARVAGAPEGTRNDTLNRAAFSVSQLVQVGHVTGDEAWQALTRAASACGLDERETRATLRSGWRGATHKPRATVPDPDADPHPPDVTVIEDIDPDTETDFWDARPLLRHIHDSARARMVAPWAVLGVTLARALALTPWTVHLPPIVGAAASLNLAVALVAASGGGKGGAEGCARDAIHMPHIPEFRIGSGEAIAHCLKHRLPAKQGGGVDWNTGEHNALINITEVDKLTAQAQRTGATIMPELRAAWSGEALGHVTADASRRLPVEKDSYRLALILGVQPGRAAGLLEDSDGGFPQRLLWLPAHDRDAPGLDDLPEPPEPTTWTPPRVTGTDRTIPVCDTAVRQIRQARWLANRGEGDPLDGHLLLAREKVAAALGILDGRYAVTDEDWRLAGTVIDKSSSVRETVRAELARRATEEGRARAEVAADRAVLVEERTIDAAVRRVCGVVVRRLRAGGWVAHGVLYRAVPKRDRDHFSDAVRRLIDAGQIEWSATATRTGKGAYRATGKGS